MPQITREYKDRLFAFNLRARRKQIMDAEPV